MADTKVLTPDMLTEEGLTTLWSVIANTFEPSVEGKGLSTNDFSDEDKAKLEAMEDALETEVEGAFKVKGTVDAILVAATEEVPEHYTIDATCFAEGYTPVVGDVFSVVVTSGGVFKTGDVFIASEQGQTLPSGTNIVYTENGWDVITGYYDFNPMLKKSDVEDITDDEIDDICKMPEEAEESTEGD